MATNPDGSQYVPLFFYVVYELEDGLHGYIIDHKPAWEASKDYGMVYKFNGRQAHYWIATNDYSIVRADALAFAVAVHEGKVRRFSCELSQVGR